MSQRDVVLYVHQPGSMEGTQTEEFLRQRGVGFMVVNVAEDEEAFAELERMGATTTPVTVAGEEVIVGFDPERLEKLATSNRRRAGKPSTRNPRGPGERLRFTTPPARNHHPTEGGA